MRPDISKYSFSWFETATLDELEEKYREELQKETFEKNFYTYYIEEIKAGGESSITYKDSSNNNLELLINKSTFVKDKTRYFFFHDYLFVRLKTLLPLVTGEQYIFSNNNHFFWLCHLCCFESYMKIIPCRIDYFCNRKILKIYLVDNHL